MPPAVIPMVVMAVGAASAAAAAGYTVYEGRAGAGRQKKARNAQAAQFAELNKEGEPPMPNPDDKAVQRSRQRSIARRTGRSGRRGTILTQNSGSGGELGG